jgi:hypothetical protein
LYESPTPADAEAEKLGDAERTLDAASRRIASLVDGDALPVRLTPFEPPPPPPPPPLLPLPLLPPAPPLPLPARGHRGDVRGESAGEMEGDAEREAGREDERGTACSVA